MTEKTEHGESGSLSKIKLTKKIVPFEESTPAEEPLFINYAQVVHAGGSFYIDVGVIPLDDILSMSDEATFLLLSRLVMSRETMYALGQQIASLLPKIHEDSQIDIVQE